MTEPFPNPELDWERRAETTTLSPAEIERRLGRVPQTVEVLGGGLANLNARIDGAAILRIYRRHPGARAKETALLRRPWQTFRVPAILAEGDDWLLLEHVEHGRLRTTAEHGAAVGRALAEIHAIRPPSSGMLGPALDVVEPFADFVGALRDHTAEQLGGLAPDLATRVLAVLDEHAAELRAGAGPTVLLHGDYKPSNLHWTPRGELLVLDWEFAYAGAALMDVAQLFRWAAPPAFVDAFAAEHPLPAHWRRLTPLLDLVNVSGLLARSEPGSRRAADALRLIERTVTLV